MRFGQYVFFAIFLIVAQSAYAQSDTEMAACVDRANGVSTKMLECGRIEIEKWDARLNAAYQTLLQRETSAARSKLQHEQRAWLRNHLSETRRIASDPTTGSGAFMLSQDFELDDIAKRTLELERRVHS